MSINNLHIKVLEEYYSQYLGLNIKSLAEKYEVSVDEIEDIIDDLINNNLLTVKELKSKELGNYEKSSVEIITITALGKIFLENNR